MWRTSLRRLEHRAPLQRSVSASTGLSSRQFQAGLQIQHWTGFEETKQSLLLLPLSLQIKCAHPCCCLPSTRPYCRGARRRCANRPPQFEGTCGRRIQELGRCARWCRPCRAARPCCTSQQVQNAVNDTVRREAGDRRVCSHMHSVQHTCLEPQQSAVPSASRPHA